MTAEFIAVIPVRYASTRLPGKPLADIGGRPMIEWVHERACASGASAVIVATDDQRIAEACKRFDARVELTAAHHASGTDRIAELARRLRWSDEQIVVNVQGDEPLVPPALIAQTAQLLAARPEAAIATLTTALTSAEDWRDPNAVKVVTDRDGWALYFSRAPIPHLRDGGIDTLGPSSSEAPSQSANRSPNVLTVRALGQRHIGLYAYRSSSLTTLAATAPCALEEAERLEQLRALWLGMRIAVAEAVEPPPRGVDTEEDLAAIRRHIATAGHEESVP